MKLDRALFVTGPAKTDKWEITLSKKLRTLPNGLLKVKARRRLERQVAKQLDLTIEQVREKISHHEISKAMVLPSMGINSPKSTVVCGMGLVFVWHHEEEENPDGIPSV